MPAVLLKSLLGNLNKLLIKYNTAHPYAKKFVYKVAFNFCYAKDSFWLSISLRGPRAPAFANYYRLGGDSGAR